MFCRLSICSAAVAFMAFAFTAEGPAFGQSQPAAKPGEAAEPVADNASARRWLVSCSDDAPNGGSQCRMVQTLAVQKTGQRLLTIVVQKEQSAPAPRIVIGLPHGVFFPAGVGLAVDEGPESNLVVQTSDANGAYAMTDVSNELLKALQTGETLKVAFESGNKQPITIPVSLEGFGDAYKRVSAFGG